MTQLQAKAQKQAKDLKMIEDMQKQVDKLEQQCIRIGKNKEIMLKEKEENEKRRIENQKMNEGRERAKDQEKTKLEEEMKGLKESNAKMKAENDKLTQKMNEMKKERDIMTQKIKETKHNQPKKEQEPNKENKEDQTTLIADSNRKYIAPYLSTQETKWQIQDTIYTITQLEEEIGKQLPQISTAQSNRVMIMLGTNDVRNKQAEPDVAAARLLECAKWIAKNRNIAVTIITPPPTNITKDPETAVNIDIMNAELKEIKHDRIDVIDLTDSELDNTPKEQTLQKDGFHLSDIGAKIVAEKINKEINKKTSKTRTKTNNRNSPVWEKEEFVELEERNVKHIVGKGGQTIHSLMDTFNTIVTIKQKIKDNQIKSGAMIMGKEEDVKRTKKRIEEIVNRIDNTERENEKRREERKEIICSYYRYGKGCKYGNRCQYSHRIPEERTNSPTPRRSRSASRPRQEEHRHQREENRERRDRYYDSGRNRDGSRQRSRSPREAHRHQSPRRRMYQHDERRERRERHNERDRHGDHPRAYNRCTTPETRERRERRTKRSPSPAPRNRQQRGQDNR